LINVSNHSSDDTLPDVSADSNRVVFTSKRDRNSEIYLVDLEEKTLINISNSPLSDTWADISGDGNKVAFQSNRDGNWEVYLADLNSRTLINVSNAPRASDIYPRISEDGNKVVFQSNRDGNEEVYLADLKGRGPKGSIQIELWNISNDSKFDGIPTISKDGMLIAFSSLRDGNTEVYLSDLERMTLTNISNHPASDNGVLAISIDNKNVAFVSERNKNRDVYLVLRPRNKVC